MRKVEATFIGLCILVERSISKLMSTFASEFALDKLTSLENCIFYMFHEERLPNVQVRVLMGEREELTELDLEMNHTGDLYLNDLMLSLR